MRSAAMKKGSRAVGVAAGLAIVLVGCGGGGSSTPSPKDVVQKYADGLKEHNYSKACDQVTPSLQQQCNEGLPSAGIKLTSFKVGKQVVQGDRAMVSITGTLCGASGECHTYSTKNSGMPGGGKSFDEAYAAASSSDTAADIGATVLVKNKGRWYVQLN